MRRDASPDPGSAATHPSGRHTSVLEDEQRSLIIISRPPPPPQTVYMSEDKRRLVEQAIAELQLDAGASSASLAAEGEAAEGCAPPAVRVRACA